MPRGNKVTKHFLVPDWIKDNKEFSREYLRTAFDCEGSIWFEKKPKIRFGIFKTKDKLSNGLQFIDELKTMLDFFDVGTSKTWLMKGNIHKGGVATVGLYFKIKQDSITKFAEQIGFSDRFKNGRLILCR